MAEKFGFGSVNCRHLAEGAQANGAGAISAVVEKMQATETNVPQCAIPSRTISILPRSRTDASKQIVSDSVWSKSAPRASAATHVGCHRFHRRYGAGVGRAPLNSRMRLASFSVDGTLVVTAKEEDLSKEQVKSNIRESDYPGLDILPSNLAYRKFDLLLDRMKKRRSQLRRLLEPFEEDYDRIMLDSPPNITLLSENLFSCFRPDLGAGDSNDALGAHPRATFPVLHGEGATPGGYSPVFLDGPEA
jgi:hypothetical protein